MRTTLFAATAATLSLTAAKAIPSLTTGKGSPSLTTKSIPSTKTLPRRDGGSETALYWGANDSERSLGEYCASGQGVDIIIVSFLSQLGGGVYPNGYLGSCSVNPDGSSDGCDSVASDIDTCKNAGIKVFISFVGAQPTSGPQWELTGSGDATGVAYSLWNSYANPAAISDNSKRPFGDTFVNGWDVDVEDEGSNGSSDQYLGDLINALRGYFSDDSDNTYYISGAPQCPIPDAYVGDAIQNAQFDYLWIQFYNNNCAAADLFGSGNPEGDGSYNFADWPAAISGGASANAKLFVGIPGSSDAADSFDFVDPSNLVSLVDQSSGVAGFGGIMVYDAGASDESSSSSNGCNYVQNVHNVLENGSAC